MKESIYHLLGLCGEYSHPNLIHLTAIVLVVFIVKLYRRKSYEQ